MTLQYQKYSPTFLNFMLCFLFSLFPFSSPPRHPFFAGMVNCFTGSAASRSSSAGSSHPLTAAPGVEEAGTGCLRRAPVNSSTLRGCHIRYPWKNSGWGCDFIRTWISHTNLWHVYPSENGTHHLAVFPGLCTKCRGCHKSLPKKKMYIKLW